MFVGIIGIIIASLIMGGVGIGLLILRRKENKSIADHSEFRARGTLFYHEDDFCQIQLLPAENLSWLLEEAENVADFAEVHFVGGGYSDLLTRTGAKVALRERKIPVAELDLILNKLQTTRHTEITTGYGERYRIASPHTIGYGHDYSAIYFDFKNDLVENIWMTNIFALDSEHLKSVLLELGKKWNLFLMDWNALKLIDLRNEQQVIQYLK